MHNKKDKEVESKRKPYSLRSTDLWSLIGGVRNAREQLPFSSSLLSFLLNGSTPGNAPFVIGFWLATLDGRTLNALRTNLTKYGHDDEGLALTSKEEEDLTFVAELALFEEKAGEAIAKMYASGRFGEAVKAVGYCACLEELSRRGMVSCDRIAMNPNNLRAEPTDLGRKMAPKIADRDLVDALAQLIEDIELRKSMH